MSDDIDNDIVATEWNDVALEQIRKRLFSQGRLAVAFCVVAVDPETKDLGITADILGDISGPIPESDRAAILQVFQRFEEDIKRIFGAVENPMDKWGHLKKESVH